MPTTTSSGTEGDNLDRAWLNVQRANQLLDLNGGYNEMRLQAHLNKVLIYEFRNICYRDSSNAAAQYTKKTETIDPMQPLKSAVVPRLELFYTVNKERFTQLDPGSSLSLFSVVLFSVSLSLSVVFVDFIKKKNS